MLFIGTSAFLLSLGIYNIRDEELSSFRWYLEKMALETADIKSTRHERKYDQLFRSTSIDLARQRTSNLVVNHLSLFQFHLNDYGS